MPRIAKLSKAEIADQLTGVFEQYGYDGASLAQLATVSGLSKASLYHHFPKGKIDMAAYALGQAGVRLQKLVLAPLSQDITAKERLESSFEGVMVYYSGKIPSCLMNSLMLGGGRVLFREQIKTAVAMWQTKLAATYREATGEGERSAVAWSSEVVGGIQGALVLCRVQQSRSPLVSYIKALKNAL